MHYPIGLGEVDGPQRSPSSVAQPRLRAQ